MFFFGDPVDSARLYLENAAHGYGPVLPTGILEELSEKEVRILMTYQRVALENSVQDEVDDDVYNILLQAYDTTFSYLSVNSESFRNLVDQGKHQYYGGYSQENIDKYRVLAALPRKTVRPVRQTNPAKAG